MNKYFKILLECTDKVSREHLVRKYGEALVDEVIKNGYIVEIGKTDIGDPQHIITTRGKEIRDKKF